MKRILSAFLSPFLALLALVLPMSCSQDTTLTVSTDVTSFHFDPTGGECDVVVFTNGSWTASSSDSAAVVLSPASGDYTQPMHILLGRNDEHFTKNIRITLTSTLDNLTRTCRIALTQDCDPFLDAAATEATVGAAGGAVRFSVNGNLPWKVVSRSCDGQPSDFVVDPSSAGPNTVEVALWIPANDTGASRSFSARLALEDAPAVTLTLTVRQAA